MPDRPLDILMGALELLVFGTGAVALVVAAIRFW
jgi:hypothetical protein